MFEAKKKKERRFTAKVSGVEVEEKAKMIGEKLGYVVKKKMMKKEGEVKVVGLGRGRTVIVVEAVELTVDVVVVEVKVVEGEEVIIAKGNHPVVKLVLINELRPKRRLGTAKGKIKISNDFDKPLDDFKEYM